MRDYAKYKDRLRDYLAMKGIEIKNNRCHCLDPAHKDKKPSCAIYKSVFYCFSCGITGNIYDAVQLLENIMPDIKKQFDFLEGFFSKHFKCALCGGVFEKGWGDEEAEAEQKENFPGVPISECSLICDDCYEKKMKEVRGESGC
jgi:Fe2+ or Zn2+ uptake regulation protein